MVAAVMRLAGRWEDERGQGLVEYALILMLVSMALLVILRDVGSNVAAMYSSISAALP
jgi:Flp pilus assembly pilin Flp